MVKAIVGANWGDEGKGKVTDMMAEHSDVVIRFQGGANAGHTIINDYGRFALHILPSGIFYPHITNIIGNGVALDIMKLVDELKSITDQGVPVRVQVPKGLTDTQKEALRRFDDTTPAMVFGNDGCSTRFRITAPTATWPL